MDPFSPRTWGCTWRFHGQVIEGSVFPTHVGVYRWSHRRAIADRRFPHARGGVPGGGRTKRRLMTFSPRTWGCTFRVAQRPIGQWVFPTHVGVYLTRWWLPSSGSSFPHARGGVPTTQGTAPLQPKFSPRTWGCTARGYFETVF